jgi:hypothetical protein
MLSHNHLGNCWDAPYSCSKCGGELCDVCHKHDEPRGECSMCAECPECAAEDLMLERSQVRK